MSQFLEEILRLAQVLSITRAELLLMAREIAGDAKIRGVFELRPSHMYALLLLVEDIRDAKTAVAQVRTEHAMMTACR